eukprot:TRINITY_DN25500_c0_g2_i1.p1 TRINITY_DN25500_c0_g2~~TRINITY_DN25500_c0_g2_i1.p1  ORF type:complete len:482 (+),score=80.62 TRINITY_DN25500_c0_g2_i1:69-1448(+)
MRVGEDAVVRSGGVAGRITQTNGHAYKVCGRWYHESDVEAVSLEELLGTWQYGSKPLEYRIVRAESGKLYYFDQKKCGVVSGILEPRGQWVQAELSSASDLTPIGVIRLAFSRKDECIVSNFKAAGKDEWGKDVVAHKVQHPLDPRYVLGRCGIGELPSLLDASSATMLARVLQAFVMLSMGSSVLVQITGGRYEVFVAGFGSEPFLEFAKHHSLSQEVLRILEELKRKLADVAVANGGKVSEDIVALIGSPEMQAPHLDLKSGQVQIIVALTATAPTLVYDTTAEKPSLEEAFDAIGVHTKFADSPNLCYLAHGGTPLVLPASILYDRMVPACQDFTPGDAVQIRDGIVHAGPKWLERPGQPPRIVLFATYSTLAVRPYNVEFQYKLWDWAYCSQVPADVAYRRLLDVRKVTAEKGMNVCPWVYFDGASAQACKTLCTTPGLDGAAVEQLVQIWRHGS